ncbi:MAG: HAD family hydrolase [Chloroflexota bacterium]|nr:HAD family hydrolase [Chloroflexota bacterium]
MRRVPPPSLDAVFLDVGDTLIRAHPSWAGVYRLGLADCGIDVGEEELERALLEETQAGGWWLFEDPFEPTEEVSFTRIKEFDAAVLRRLGHGQLADDVFRAIETAFARRSAWHVYPDVLPALGALREAGLRLGVISNFVWGGPELFHDLELAAHFDALVVSARIGFQKPHAGIFRHALAQLAVEADRALHVGDSYRADILGARGVGMAAVLIDRNGRDPARIREEHADEHLTVVHDLYALLDVLGIGRPRPNAS